MTAIRANEDDLYDTDHLEAGLQFLGLLIQAPFFRKLWLENHA
jgi:hypothetical protein